MKILITGGAGFIGSHLAEYHLAQGDEVYVIDDLSTGSLGNIESFEQNSRFQFEKTDILNWDNVNKIVQWAELIYHLAAVVGIFRVLSDPIHVLSTNIIGTEKIFQAVASCGSKAKIVVMSSSSVYGHTKKKILNEKNDLIIKASHHPLKNYALSKIALEAYSLTYDEIKEIPTIVVRLFNTVGPRQTGVYGMVVPRFVRQACEGKPITIFGDGTQTRSFCDVRDAVEAMHLLTLNPKSNGQIVNVGNDQEIVIKHLADLVKEKAASSSPLQYIPYEEAYGEELVDIHQRHPDLTKLYKLTGFKHKWPLEKTIDDLITRFRIAKKS